MSKVVNDDLGDLFDEDDPADEDGSDGADGAGAPPPKQPATPPKGDAKRINDLMGRAQRAEARAAKAEGLLKDHGVVEGQAPKKSAPASEPDELPPSVKRWLDQAKLAERGRLVKADPRFERYGLEETLIDGETPEAMAEAADRLGALLSKVETVVRNATLAEYGMVPASEGGGAVDSQKFADMDDAEFEKFLAGQSSRSGVI